ncbi:MAG: hypothetical protein Q9212_005080, partial [Teloschistes hypoglaucus]
AHDENHGFLILASSGPRTSASSLPLSGEHSVPGCRLRAVRNIRVRAEASDGEGVELEGAAKWSFNCHFSGKMM